MGVENAGSPTQPKKKLKQAQLPFCIVTPKANKRKLSNAADDAAEEVPVKVLCQQATSTPPKSVLTEKEDNLEAITTVKVTELGDDLDKTNKPDVLDKGNDDDVVEDQDSDVETNKKETEESEMNVTATSDAQNSGGDRSLDCSLVLTLSASDSESDVAPNCESTPESTKNQKSNKEVKKPQKRKQKTERSVERERLKKEKELERTRQKEEKMRLKQEKENARKKEKEDKEQKRLAEIRAKEEEKKRKEEAKEEARRQKELEKKIKEDAKEEEKRKKEEEKLALERKENLAKQAFSKFFKRPKTSEPEPAKNQPEKQFVQKFMPFPVKHDMKLAVVCRNELCKEAKNKLTAFLENRIENGSDSLYLKELKDGVRKPGKSEATWPSSDEVHDVIIIESVKDEEEVEKTIEIPTKKKQSFRAKLFQFQENRRPPYWGTWRKKSVFVSARKPFGKEKILDYDVDSDSEWEDEGEGEDLEKENESDNEKEQSDDENVGENGYLIDNSVFVPHGYLSDEEAEDEENCDPESQKLRMTALKREFDEEMKQSTSRLQPKVLGCVWISNETTEVSKGSLYQMLMNHRCIWNENEGPIDLSGPVVEDTPPTPAATSQKSTFPEILIEPLVKMVHGSQLSHIALVKEFMSYIEKEEVGVTASKRAVSLKIKDIAVKTSSANGPAWQVSADLCARFGLPFVTEKKIDDPPSPVVTDPVTPKGVVPLTNFFKKVPAVPPPKDPLASYPQIKKRVLLISLPRLGAGDKEKTGLSGATDNVFTPQRLAESEKAANDPSDVPTPDGCMPPPPTPNIKLPSAPTPPLLTDTVTATASTPDTPTSSTTPKLKKRITPITLSRTPSTPNAPPPVHQDTPRPLQVFFKTFKKD